MAAWKSLATASVRRRRGGRSGGWPFCSGRQPFARLGRHARRAIFDGERLSREALDRLKTRPLAVIAKRDGDSGCPGAARAADAMNVAVCIGRQIEVHDVRNLVDVQPAGGNVGCHQDQRLRRFEAKQYSLPSRLALVAVKGVGFDARLHQRLGNFVCAVLGAREYQRPRPRGLRSQCVSSCSFCF